MERADIVAYLRQYRGEFTDKALYDSLLKQGVPEDELKAAFQEVYVAAVAETAPASSGRRSFLFLGIGAAAIIVVLVIFFMRTRGPKSGSADTGTRTLPSAAEIGEAVGRRDLPVTRAIPSAAEIEEAAGTTFAFFNNHARGSAARNAELFIELLRNRYGDAADIVARRGGVPAQGTLF